MIVLAKTPSRRENRIISSRPMWVARKMQSAEIGGLTYPWSKTMRKPAFVVMLSVLLSTIALTQINGADVAEAKLIRGTLKGRVLSTGTGRVLLLDQTGKILWKHKGRNCSDIWMLAGGNVIMGIYGVIRGKDGAGLLEITREKKLVWRYASPDKKGDRHMMGVQLLDEKGKPLPGPALR